jgi:glycolate oxidase
MYCNQERIKIVPRGAGTGLSGGALPLEDGILLSLERFNKILEIDYKNRCVVVQPGVTNLAITQAVQIRVFIMLLIHLAKLSAALEETLQKILVVFTL